MILQRRTWRAITLVGSVIVAVLLPGCTRPVYDQHGRVVRHELDAGKTLRVAGAVLTGMSGLRGVDEVVQLGKVVSTAGSVVSAVDGLTSQTESMSQQAWHPRQPPSVGEVGAEPCKPMIDCPVRVKLSSTIGIAPLVVSYAAVLPDHIRKQADFLWTDNGEPISNKRDGQLFLATAGEHEIAVLVTKDDGQHCRASRTVTVLARIRPRR